MTGIGENTLAQPVKPPLRERHACLAKLVKNRLTLTLLDATDPRSEGYMAEWGALTANVPATAEWCRGRGNIAIDADVPAALLEALETAGAVRMAGRSAASGMARNPLATVAGPALDGMGRLTETVLPDKSTQKTAYTRNGQVSRTTDALGSRTTYTYDQNGNQLTVTDPQGNVTTRANDPAGNLLTETNALGGVTQYT